MLTRIKIFFLFSAVILHFCSQSAVAQDDPTLAPLLTAPSPTPIPNSTPIQAPAQITTPAFSAESSTWEVQGEAIMDLRLHQKPSSLVGAGTFQLPWINLSFSREFSDGPEFTVEVMSTTPSTGTTDINLRQVAVLIPEVLGRSTDLQVGLIGNALFASEQRFYSYRRLANEFGFQLQRYGYLPDTDYGFQLETSLSESWSLGLQATNGEGRGKSETGPRKDFALWLAREWRFETGRSWLLTLFGSRGGYETVPPEDSIKDRAQISLWTTREEGLSLGAEYNWAMDSVDAINKVVADQVDLTVLGGQRVTAVGYVGYFRYQWLNLPGPAFSIFYRGERWEPVKGNTDYAIQSSQLGLGYRSRANVQWQIYNTLTNYGLTHSLTARDNQSWRISLDLTFD